MKKSDKNGFTLVELLFVVLIISVLASIVIPRISTATGEAKDAKDKANWANLIRALEMYAVKNDGVYPTNQGTFDSLILNNLSYFPHGKPVCPHNALTIYAYVATAGQQTVTKHSSGN
jgi:prepilin-type N-terminal cleavage/methylation domain-containing protein